MFFVVLTMDKDVPKTRWLKELQYADSLSFIVLLAV